MPGRHWQVAFSTGRTKTKPTFTATSAKPPPTKPQHKQPKQLQLKHQIVSNEIITTTTTRQALNLFLFVITFNFHTKLFGNPFIKKLKHLA